MFRRLTIAIALTFIVIATQLQAAESIESFTLRDFRGKTHSLEDYQDKQIVVLAFIGTECPLVKLYGPRLQKLHDKYAARGVVILGVNANMQDSVTEIAAYARNHQIDFPILKDLGNKVADRLGAERTPEVFVLDKSRSIRYHGRIDDQYGVGYIRDNAEKHDLANALEELLAGKSVSQPKTEVVGCHIGRIRTPDENPTVTYSKHISRILQKRCVECHRDGEIAPFALTDYDEVVGWAEMIAEVIEEQRMPPWHATPHPGHFSNDRGLTSEEKELIYSWVDQGAPQGDVKDLPEPRSYIEGWRLNQKPDAVFVIQSTPFKVKAEGEVRYQMFFVDPKWTEDKWVKSIEIQPGNRAVVHHILAFARGSTGGLFDEGKGYLAGYVPGLRATEFPAGMAKKIPAGAKLGFQVHYTPIGTEQLDQSRIGFVFADPKDVTHQVVTTSALNRRFTIPANEKAQKVEASSGSLDFPVQLLSMSPHMHLRGKSFSYAAVFPNQKEELLLDIPKYDFNWQTSYQLTKPLKLPAGTRLHTVAHFDNSPQNLNNPDSNKTVRWGDQTWDEMMIGYFNIAIDRDYLEKPLADVSNKRAVQVFKQLDSNGDDELQADEVPQKLKIIFSRLDKNKDGVVTRKELMDSIKSRR
ncbi:MAG: peroxiredoxin [Pirellulaceae bacterium]|jgi:peroxiredoxin